MANLMETSESVVTIGDIARENGRSHGSAMATICSDSRLSFAEIDARTNRLANAFMALGVEQGDRILWLGQNCHRLLECLLACGKMGAVLVPANWRLTPPELDFIIRDLNPRVVIWQDQTIGENVRAVRLLSTDEAVWIQHDGEEDGSYESLIAGGKPDDPSRAIDPNQAIIILYTAAYEGRPGGAMCSHSGVIAHCMLTANIHGINHRSRQLNCGPLFHVASLRFALATFQVAGSNVFVPDSGPLTICEAIHTERCTGAFIIEPTISRIIELINSGSGNYDLSSLLTASDAKAEWKDLTSVDQSPWGRDPGGYGQTECFGLITARCFGGTGANGRPLPTLQVRILDTEQLELRPGEVGEIVVRGPTVMLGFHNRPERNAACFKHGWYYTSDLGRREMDGSITFIGPRGRLIRSASESIYPSEIEACLATHPAVAEAVALGIPDPIWGQSVRVVVVLKSQEIASPDELIDHCVGQLASYKRPRSVVIRDEALPRKGSSIDYAEVDAQYGGGGYPGFR